MPQLIQTADEIARERGQDILLVDFRRAGDLRQILPSKEHDRTARIEFLEWLKGVPEIEFLDAYPPLPRGLMICPYFGTIALIVCKDRQPKLYKTIVDRWEEPDGSPILGNVRLFIVSKDHPSSGDDHDE